jgi:hypothetical protein
MGNCGSVEDKAEKERSDQIDKQIEEDAKKFRKECKILLLGSFSPILLHLYSPTTWYSHVLARSYRQWRRRQIDHRQTNEDHPSKRVHSGRTRIVETSRLPQPRRLSTRYRPSHARATSLTYGSFQRGLSPSYEKATVLVLMGVEKRRDNINLPTSLGL